MSEKPPLPLCPMVRCLVAGVGDWWWRPADPMSAQRRVREPA